MDLEELERKEREFDERLREMERFERELSLRLSVIEEKLKIRAVKRRRYQLMDALRNEGMKLEDGIRGRSFSVKKDGFERRLKKILEKSDESSRKEENNDYEREELKKNIVPEDDSVRKKAAEGRRRILRREIGRIVGGGRRESGEDTSDAPSGGGNISVKNFEISASDDDARLLFKVLLKKGVMRTNEAARELGVNEDKIKSWARDLKEMGVIDLTEYPYRPFEMKLRGMDTAMNGKAVKDAMDPSQSS